MKITPEDMFAIQNLMECGMCQHSCSFHEKEEQDRRNISLAYILIEIWDKGHAAGMSEGFEQAEQEHGG